MSIIVGLASSNGSAQSACKCRDTLHANQREPEQLNSSSLFFLTYLYFRKGTHFGQQHIYYWKRRINTLPATTLVKTSTSITHRHLPLRESKGGPNHSCRQQHCNISSRSHHNLHKVQRRRPCTQMLSSTLHQRVPPPQLRAQCTPPSVQDTEEPCL